MKSNNGESSSATPPSGVGAAQGDAQPVDPSDMALGTTRVAPPSSGSPLPTEALFAMADPGGGEVRASSAPVIEVKPGTLINRYMVLSRLGEGGMGVVYAAFDTRLERKIAIKLLHREASLDGTEGRARMLREAQVLAQLAHPNVVSIFDVGLHNGQVFIGMEFLDGGTLTDWSAQKRREPSEVLELYIQAGWGLGAAHAANFIHRDFKPDNVLLGKDGRARVTDFGVARLASRELAPVRPDLEALSYQMPESGLHTPLTMADALVGTPLYMAPEQFDGRPVDARTDQFSFCVALYESLYGQRPFAGNTLTSLYRNLMDGRVLPAPPQSRVPGWLRSILLRGLSTAPEARFANMDELLLALGRDPRVIWRRRALTFGAAALLLTLGSTAAYFASRPSRDPCLAVRQQAENSLNGVWDADAKLRIGGALQNDQGKADAVWQKLTTTLDDYTQQWVDMQHAACIERRRTSQPQRPALRKLCLGLLYSELTALGPMLAKPTQQSVGNALAAVWSLPPVRSCDDDHTLASFLPLLADPKERQVVEDLTRQLEAVRVSEPGSEYKSVLATARSIEVRARSTKYRPLQAESLLVLGGLQQQVSDRAGATKSLTQAAVDGLASGQLPVAAEAFARLVTLTAIDKKFELAETYAQLAGATVTMLGKNELSQARLLHAQGDLAVAAFKFEDALRLHDQALELRKSLDRAHPDLAESYGKRAFSLRRLHRNEEALQAFGEALAIYKLFYGENYPRVMMTVRWQATTLAESGRLPQALALLNEVWKKQQAQSAALPKKDTDKPDPDQELTLREIARTHLMLGEYEQAAEYAEKAIAKAVPGKESTSAVMKARALACLGKLPEALAVAELAQKSSRKLTGPQSIDYADATYYLATILFQQGEIAKALQLHTEVLGIREKLLDPLDRANSLIAIGSARSRSKQAAQGLADIDQALTLLDSSGSPKAGFSYLRRHAVADAKAAKASALYELAHHHKNDEMLALLSQAQSIYADPRTPDPCMAKRLAGWPKFPSHR